MRYLLSMLVLLASTLSACAPAGAAREPAAAESDPCEDARYQRLKEMPLDEMSEREYEYFMQKDEACANAEGSAKEPGRLGWAVVPVGASAYIILVSLALLL